MLYRKVRYKIILKPLPFKVVVVHIRGGGKKLRISNQMVREEQEIKDKILELYNSRERFTKLVKDERKKSAELESAFYLVEKIYTEKIEILNWALNKEEPKS